MYTHTRASSRMFLMQGLVLLLPLLFLIAVPVQAAVERPWYAQPLEALGFFVFDQPFEQPNFTVSTLTGSIKPRTATKGNITLLNFWATWCPPCKQEIPTIQKLHDTMKGEKFEIMAISVGEPLTTVKSFVERNKLSFPVYLDPKNTLSAVYASRGIPTTYLLDKNGKFIAGIIGAFEYDNPAFLSIVKELSRR
ncbi:MAG: TlpA disulfide reductase family protein [Spirochaetales bacterium]|nr:TlpA disulfide reductase family protein [Spirochaetales bacterium]